MEGAAPSYIDGPALINMQSKHWLSELEDTGCICTSSKRILTERSRGHSVVRTGSIQHREFNPEL
jgi:hypothetical protein